MSRRGPVVVALSVAVHLAVLRAAWRAGRSAARAPHTMVTLEVAPPPIRVPEPPPPAAPPPPRIRHRPPPAARAAAPAPAPPLPAAPEPPADPGGVTLTAEDEGDGWVSAVGSGAPLASTAPPAAPARPAASAPPGPPLVALADLGRRPGPPPLAAELARAYPAEARRTGAGGTAIVKARIRPDGSIERVRILEASTSDFGEACRRVLLASHWSPPADRTGTPCATEIRYTCRFEVARW